MSLDHPESEFYLKASIGLHLFHGDCILMLLDCTLIHLACNLSADTYYFLPIAHRPRLIFFK